MAELSQISIFGSSDFNELFIVKCQNEIKAKLLTQTKKYPLIIPNLNTPEFYLENVAINHHKKLIKIDDELKNQWENENYEFVFFNLNRLFKVDEENKLKINKPINPNTKQKSPNYCPNFHKLTENQIMLRDLKLGGNRIIGKYAISRHYNLLGSYDENSNSITIFSQCFNSGFRLHNSSVPVQLNVANIKNYPGYILMNETANEYIDECCDHNDNNAMNFMYSNLNNISISDNNRNRITAKSGFNDMEEKANLYRKFCNSQIELYKKWLNKEFVIVDENLNPINVKLNEIKFKPIDEKIYPQKPHFDPQSNFIHEIAYNNYNFFISNINENFVELDEKNCPIKEQPEEIKEKIIETFNKRKTNIMEKRGNSRPKKATVFNRTLQYANLKIDSKNKEQIQEITDELYDKFYEELKNIIKEFKLEFEKTKPKPNNQKTRFEAFINKKPAFSKIVTKSDF